MTDRDQRDLTSGERLAGLLIAAFRSGSIAGLAMIPFGVLFYLSGLRINEYGLKVIQTFFGDLPVGMRVSLFIGEHFLISWSAAVPLLIGLVMLRTRLPKWLMGAAYGGSFYLLVNSLALPLVFGDPLPWVLGFNAIYPSLVVHLVYGIVVALTAKGLDDKLASIQME